MKKIVDGLKNRGQDLKNKFKEYKQEYKEKPKSKRKSFMIGFGTVLAIFGVTFFGPALSADLPNLYYNINIQ